MPETNDCQIEKAAFRESKSVKGLTRQTDKYLRPARMGKVLKTNHFSFRTQSTGRQIALRHDHACLEFHFFLAVARFLGASGSVDEVEVLCSYNKGVMELGLLLKMWGVAIIGIFLEADSILGNQSSTTLRICGIQFERWTHMVGDKLNVHCQFGKPCRW